MDKVKVVVVGAGNMGTHHARIISAIKSAALVAVVDTNQQRANRLANQFGVKGYSSLYECLKYEKPDAAIVATPTDTHFEVARTLINQEIAVLVEKPIAATVKEAESLLQLVKKQKVIASVGHTERYNPAVRKLKELLDSGELGSPISVHTRRLGLKKPHNPRKNVLQELGVHDIDVFAFLTGGYNKLKAKIVWRTPQEGEELLAGGILLTKNEINGFVEASWLCHYKLRSLTVVATEAFAVVNYITQKLSVFTGKSAALFDNRTDGFATFLLEFGELKQHDIPIQHGEPLKLQDEDFIQSIISGRQPQVSFEEGLAALKLASV